MDIFLFAGAFFLAIAGTLYPRYSILEGQDGESSGILDWAYCYPISFIGISLVLINSVLVILKG